MDEQNMDILERIHASYYQLTAAERKVADYVLSQYTRVQFMSITQLADECGTAEATISRFCRNLKLKGFNAFKLELAKHSASVSVADYAAGSSSGTETPEGRTREVGRLSMDAVSQTIELVNTADISRTIDLFEQAGRILCIGAGGSMIMAQEFAHLFSLVSSKFQVATDAHMQMSAVANMEPRDVIVLFSYSGATTAGVQVLELAKAKGIHTVLVTRFSKSPAANLADVVLRCGATESPVQTGSVRAKVAQLVIMDVLFQEYCFRNREACEENMQSIASALSGLHV